MTLIADSGSTKTAWCLYNNNTIPFYFTTSGINPVLLTQAEIENVLQTEVLPILSQDTLQNTSIKEIYFYGAGCIPSKTNAIQEALQHVLQSDKTEVHTDLLGAARALCGHKEGVACILGTGSNSCYYNGKHIIQNTAPLGYILGDEGSGAALGKRLIADLLKGILPQTLKEAFLAEYHLTPEIIIDKIYRQPWPNRFLAGFTPFLHKYRSEPTIKGLVIDVFRSFFVRNITIYNKKHLPIHFVGSIAFYFEKELEQAAQTESFKIGTVIKDPIERMVKFHQNELFL